MARILNIVFNDFTRDSRVRKISHSLARDGHMVNVLCFHELGLPKSDEQEGYYIQRVEIRTRKLKKIKLLRPLMYLEFAIRTLLLTRKYDAIHVNDVEPLPIAILVKLMSFGRVKLIYDAHELESEKTGMGDRGRKMVKAIERLSFPMVNGFITVSRSIGEFYQRQFNIEPIILFNCPHRVDSLEKNDLLRQEFDIAEDGMIFIYQGALSPKRGLEFLIQGFEELQNPSKHLIILGFGQLEDMVKEKAADSEVIHFKPGVPMEELLAVTVGADVGFSLLSADSMNHDFALPNKFFEYMAASIPVIVSPVKEMSSIVRENNIGWVMEENDSESVKKVVLTVSKEGVERSRESLQGLREIYVWEEQEKKLQQLYRDVL